jgi:hypothetical protein
MPYNAQFDLRGTQIKSNFNQITQYDTSSGNWYLGEGQPVSISSSYTISASFSTNAQNANNSTAAFSAISSSYALSSSTAISSSYALNAGILVGVPGPYYQAPFISINGNSSSIIQIGEVGDITIRPATGQGTTIDSAIGTIQNDGVNGIYIFTDVGSEIVLGTSGLIDITDVSSQGQHFDGNGSVYFDNNVTASYFVGNGSNLTNLSWSLNADTSSISISSSYAINTDTASTAISSSYAASASYTVNSDTSSISISSSYTYTASIANIIPYSSSTNFFNITSSLSTGSMYLQVGPPTFLFVYDGTSWRSSSLA